MYNDTPFMALQGEARLGMSQVSSLMEPYGMGEVYLSHDAGAGCMVHIRLLATGFLHVIIQRQWCESEVPSAASPAYTNLCGLNEIGRDGTSACNGR